MVAKDQSASSQFLTAYDRLRPQQLRELDPTLLLIHKIHTDKDVAAALGAKKATFKSSEAISQPKKSSLQSISSDSSSSIQSTPSNAKHMPASTPVEKSFRNREGSLQNLSDLTLVHDSKSRMDEVASMSNTPRTNLVKLLFSFFFSVPIARIIISVPI